MHNYNTKKLKTLLYIKSYDDLSSSFGNELPYPQKVDQVLMTALRKHRLKYIYMFAIDGTFQTNRGVFFLNDIIARMMITFPDSYIEKVDQKIRTIKDDKIPLRLKHFQNLKSIPCASKKHFEKAQRLDTQDQVFWALKLHFEQSIRHGNLSYDSLYDFALTNFIDRCKDRSTLKAKCRGIWNYYCERDFQIFCEYQRKYTDEELKMTRSKNMKKVNDLQSRENRTLVINAITGLYAEEYKSKKGEWNISKLSKSLNLARNTIYKYLMEFQQNQQK